MKKYAVIVAGGMGLRMGGSVPKQFMVLKERPVLWYTLDVFLRAFDDVRIVLVVPGGYREAAVEVINGLSGGERVLLVDGGDTRFHSVRSGLDYIKGELGGSEAGIGVGGGKGEIGEGVAREAIIFVHDGVRCLVSAELIRRCYEQAVLVGSAVPVVDCRDSVRLVGEGEHSKPIDRSRIKMVQTPQTFRGDILFSAYMQDHQEAFTDEATVVEVGGQAVHLIEGEATNIKITTPEDMVIAEVLLRR